MKNILYNLGYFLRELKAIFLLNKISNLFSVLSMGLIFLFLGMVISGWFIGSEAIGKLQSEAEINVYYDEATVAGAGGSGWAGGSRLEASGLLTSIKEIEGVKEAKVVQKEEAKGRMEEVLGNEAAILALFDENPFSSFIEVKINIEQLDSVVSKLKKLKDIQYIRDNRDVLDKLKNLIEMFKFLGILIFTGAGVFTIVVISHIIRQVINSNKDQINTLKLLGAPDYFIGFPFLLEGLIMTISGGAIAAIILQQVLNYVYSIVSGTVKFIPLPDLGQLTYNTALIVISISAALGALGSIFGIASNRE